MTNFEQVWQQILQIARTREEICTLGNRRRGVRNQIVSVHEDGITVVSERTGTKRKLRRRDFQRCWEVLIEDGQLSIPPVHVGNERIIMAFLAHLPNVEYSHEPQTLHLMPYDTHTLGTKREHVDR